MHRSEGWRDCDSHITRMSSRLSARTDAVHASQQAYFRMSASVERQAAVLAYIDAFWILGGLCLLAILLLFFARRIEPGQGVGAH